MNERNFIKLIAFLSILFIYIYFNIYRFYKLLLKLLIIDITFKSSNIISVETLNSIQNEINLNEKNIFSFLKDKNSNNNRKNNLIRILKPMNAIGNKKIRIGSKNDGGYVLLDDFKQIKYAYSFGISHEISFDKELADKNIDVFMYDHTINKLPFENTRFHWKKLGLISLKSKNDIFKTLPELLIENGHIKENNMILKLDIESAEWDIFRKLSINIIKKFKFIVGEFHFRDKNKYLQLKIIQKINKTHQIFHLNCNNCASSIINFDKYKLCSLLEISFANKADYKFDEFKETFPINGINSKNCENRNDLNSLLNIIIQF